MTTDSKHDCSISRRRLIGAAVGGSAALASNTALGFTLEERHIVLPSDPVSVPPGALSWQTLSEPVRMAVRSRGIGTGAALFPVELAELDGRAVRVHGFMQPIEATERHGRFLLTALPIHCAFCLQAGPEHLIDVRTAVPLPHMGAPITLAGRLRLMPTAPEGLFYAVEHARLSHA